ncbi:MAG: PDZ domain-containing protein [Armatimonadetes bacterium]|nr:PDZ domain-containing protein [Armatimonadota bacterium]
MACKGLDAQVVRPDDKELSQLLGKFVTVRIVNFKGVDMNYFKFDYDLTFTILMMNANGYTYSRFGTMDWTSTSSRMSLAGLKKAMGDVLALHQKGLAKQPRKQPLFTLDNIPAFSESKAARGECAHCHFANNFRFKQLRKEGKFTKDMLFQYPLPENVGVTLRVDANNVVQSVSPESPAAKAGVQPGDVVTRAGDTPVLTTADFQFALNSVSDPGSVQVRVLRKGRSLPAMTLRLPRGWRKTDISWRASQGEIPPAIGIWGEHLSEGQKEQLGLPRDKMALRVTFFFPGAAWAKTRGDLRMNDVIVGLNGVQLPSMTTRQFHAHCRLTFNVGDTVTLNVLRGNQRLELPVPCLEVE